jgi:TonB family protein
VVAPAVDVADVLRDRRAEPAGLAQMTVASLALHALLATALFLLPRAWLSGFTPPPRTVMTISLGDGAPGPPNGGFSTIGARPVQQEVTEEVKRPEPVRPPAEKTPEMTVPIPQPKPQPVQPARPSPPPPVKQAPADARGRTPTRGPETSAGSAFAETGARGQGFGLSTGGGAGSGSRLDVADFCCPEYIQLMVERIRSNWNTRVETTGETIVKFTIQRDGQIQGVEVERSSGFAALDINAQRALLMTRTLPALPGAFPNPTLPVHLSFRYER